MNRFLILLICLLSVSVAADTNKELMSSSTVVWAGLDYSLARFIGSDSPTALYNFTQKNLMFPKTLEKWNKLFLDERIEAVSRSLEKTVLTNLTGISERNKTASTNQVILVENIAGVCNELNISASEILNEVKNYKMEATNGLGLVFIIDKLVVGYYPKDPAFHNRAFGSVFMVFFDIGSRDVISVELETHPISTGGNFNTFWFGPIKDADDDLIRHRPAKDTFPAPFNPNGHNGKRQ
jgi:hypothetical protein